MPRSPLITEGACNLNCITIKIVRSGARMQCTMSKMADAVDTERLFERYTFKIAKNAEN